jgi:predicted DNA-binding transcriptional regulator YafY
MRIDIARIRTLDSLIKHKSTGNPEQLARKLQISKRTLFNTLNEMKAAFDAPISYNKIRETYYYHDEGFMLLTFQKHKALVASFLFPLMLYTGAWLDGLDLLSLII